MLFTQEFAWWTPAGYVITLAVFAMALTAVAVVYAKFAEEHGAFALPTVFFHLLFAVLSGPLAIFVLAGINALLPLGSSKMDESEIIFLALVYLVAALLVAPVIGRTLIKPRKEHGEQT